VTGGDFEPLIVALDDLVCLNRYVFETYHISYFVAAVVKGRKSVYWKRR